MATKASQRLRIELEPEPREWTQTTLATRLGVSRQAVNGWVAGRDRPSPEIMLEIENLLGIPMREWLEAAEPARKDGDAA